MLNQMGNCLIHVSICKSKLQIAISMFEIQRHKRSQWDFFLSQLVVDTIGRGLCDRLRQKSVSLWAFITSASQFYFWHLEWQFYDSRLLTWRDNSPTHPKAKIVCGVGNVHYRPAYLHTSNSSHYYTKLGHSNFLEPAQVLIVSINIDTLHFKPR